MYKIIYNPSDYFCFLVNQIFIRSDLKTEKFLCCCLYVCLSVVYLYEIGETLMFFHLLYIENSLNSISSVSSICLHRCKNMPISDVQKTS